MIVTLGFVIIVFGIILLLILDKTSKSNELKMYSSANDILDTVADNVNSISRGGSGYYRYFSVPSKTSSSLPFS